MSDSRNQKNEKASDKLKTSVFNRLGSSKPTSDKTELCPSISKSGSCRNESTCNYYHPKSNDVDIKKLKNDDYDKKSRKDDSKIKSAVTVSGRSAQDKHKTNDEKADKTRQSNSNKLRQHSRSNSRSRNNASKNSDTHKSDNHGSKNMLDTDQMAQRTKSSSTKDHRAESSRGQSSKEPRKDERSKRRSREKSRSRDRRDDRPIKKDEKSRRSSKQKRRHSTNSSNSSSSSSSSSADSSRSSSSDSSSAGSRSCSYDNSNKKNDNKKKKEDRKSTEGGHLKKLSTKPASDKLTDKQTDRQKPTLLNKSSSSFSKKEPSLKSKTEDRSQDVVKESNTKSKNIKVADKDGKKIDKVKIDADRQDLVTDGNKVKPLLAPEILAARIEKVISGTGNPKIEKKTEDRKTSAKAPKLAESKSESKSTKNVKVDAKIKTPTAKTSEQKVTMVEEGVAMKKEAGALVKGKGEGKIVMKMLKPLNKMRKDVNSLAEKNSDTSKKADHSKSKVGGDAAKPSLMKLKLEDLKTQSPKKFDGDNKYQKRDEFYESKHVDDENESKRRSDKLARGDEMRSIDDPKAENSRHVYSESERTGKEGVKRRISPEYYSKYVDSKRSRLTKYEQDRSPERSNDRDLGPPTLDHYSPHRSRSPRSRSHKHERIEGDRHSDPDNVSRPSQHQYDDRYESHRKVDSRMRRSASGQRWDLQRGADLQRGPESDDRYYDKHISATYDQRVYRDASYDRGHERIYDRDVPRDQWNRPYDRRHDEKGDLPVKEIWDDNYRRSDGYKGRTDWDKAHHDTRPSDEYRSRREMLLPPPPRIRSSSNLLLDHVGSHAESIQPFPDQDASMERVRPRGAECVPQKEEDTNDVNDILGAADLKEDLELEVESLPSRIPIVDMLEIKWKSLATGGGSQVVSSSTSIIKRWQPATILSKIGVSRQFAGQDLFERVKLACQKELESENENVVPLVADKNRSNKSGGCHKFEFLNDVALLHSNALKKLTHRRQVVSDIGVCRRALCARRDLGVRRALCKLDKDELVMFPVQMVDQDLHKQSLQMFQQHKDISVVS